MHDFRLDLLNPSGRDPEQRFDDGLAPARRHPPINFHATRRARGVYHYDIRPRSRRKPGSSLLRGEFRASERALGELKKHERTVVVSLKETEPAPDRETIMRSREIIAFHEDRPSRWMHRSTPEAAEITSALAATRSCHSRVYPTPYPVEITMNFSVPPE